MRATRVLLKHQPMIKFLGRRSVPKRKPPSALPIALSHSLTTSTPPEIDHTPQVHPASPAESLPESFAQYRQKANQHGPMMRNSGSSGAASQAPTQSYGAIGGSSARQLGSLKPKEGEFWDRNELPQRFRRTAFSEAEMEAIESGGASLF